MKQLLSSLFKIENNLLEENTLTITSPSLILYDHQRQLAHFLKRYFDESSFTLINAEIIPTDEEGPLKVKGLGTSPLFGKNIGMGMSIDVKEDQLSMVVFHPLSKAWKFTDSFYGLPKMFSGHSDLQSPLDDFRFKRGAIIFSSTTLPFSYAKFKVHLRPGINFSGAIDIESHFGIFSDLLLSNAPKVHLSGSINLDKNAPVPNQDSYASPWDDSQPLPSGISLKTDLSGIQFKVGPFGFQMESWNIYSPTSLLKWDRSQGFLPLQAIKGKFKLPGITSTGNQSAEIPATLEMPFGFREATLSLDLENSPLGKLSELSEIFGEDPLSVLPGGPLKKALEDLSVKRLSIAFVNEQKLDIRSIAVTVGMPHWKWEIWKDHFTLEDIEATFQLENPFNGKRANLNVTLEGHFLVDDIPLDAYAIKTGKTYSFSAQLPDDHQVSFKKVMSKYGEDLPVVDQLTVNRLSSSVQLSPNQYSFSLLMNEHHAVKIKLGVKNLEVSDLSFNLDKDPTNGITGSFSGKANFAGLDCELEVQKLSEGWAFEGWAAQHHPADLSELLTQTFSYLGADLGDLTKELPDVSVRDLHLSFDSPSGDFGLDGEIDVKMPFQIGKKKPELDTRFSIRSVKNANGKHQFTSWLNAKLEIGKCEFELILSLGDENEFLRAEFKAENAGVDISDLMDELATYFGFGQISIPDLGLKLTQVIFEYDITSKQMSLTAESNLGEVFLAVGESLAVPDSGTETTSGEQEMECVLGIEVKDEHLKKKTGSIGEISKWMGALGIEEGFLIISDIATQHFKLPALPDLKKSHLTSTTLPEWTRHRKTNQNPGEVSAPHGASTKANSLFDATLKLTQGLSMGAVLQEGKGAKNHSAAGKFFGLLGNVEVIIQILAGETGFEVFGAVEDVQIPLGGKSSLKLKEVAIDLKLGDEGPEFGLIGSIGIHIGQTLVTAIGRLQIDLMEMSMGLEIDLSGGSTPGPLPGTHLDRIAFQLAIFDAPPGVGIGLMGGFHIGTSGPSSNPGAYKFGIVLEIIEEVPDPLYMSFFLEEIDIGVAMVALTNEPAPSVVQDLSKEVNAKEVSFFFCEEIVILPDGSTALPGLGFSGFIEVHGFHAYADFKAGITGIAATAECDAIHLGNLLKITGDGKGIFKDCVKGDSGVFLPYQGNPHLDKKKGHFPVIHKHHPLVKPGGPIFHISSHSSPFLHLSLNATLLDAVGESITATIGKDGIAFKLDFHVKKVMDLQLSCVLNRKTGFVADADFELHYQGKVGPIIPHLKFTTLELDIQISSKIHVELAKDPKGEIAFQGYISGGFEFGLNEDSDEDKQPYEIPKLDLDLPLSSFKEVPEMLFKQLEDKADKIFEDLFGDIKKYGKEFENDVGKIGKVAKKTIIKIGHTSIKAAHKIEGKAKDTVKALKVGAKEVGRKVIEAEKDIKDKVNAADKEMKAQEQKANTEVKILDQKIQASKNNLKTDEDDLNRVWKDDHASMETKAKATWKVGEDKAKQFLLEGEEEAKKFEADAWKESDKILHSAKDAVAEIDKATKAAEEEAKKWANKFKHAFESAEKTVKHTYHSAKHFVSSFF